VTSLAIIAALLLDQLLGEPRRWHPLVGFGALVTRVEAALRRDHHPPWRQQLAGALAWSLLAAVPALGLALLSVALGGWPPAAVEVSGLGSGDILADDAFGFSALRAGGWSGGVPLCLEVLVLYLALGRRSLGEHARAVAAPLLAGDISGARRRVAMIVSRDTAHLDAAGATRATVESVLENGSDAVLAPLFWFAVAGAPGALLYRLANTLDARWGYRSSRYRFFGRPAARLDDALNWLPARLCALAYGLAGNPASALRCWRRQAPQAASPNAGPVMAAGAGALGIRIGGPARYRGREDWRPILGAGRAAEPRDIPRALTLVDRATRLWVAAIALAELACHLAVLPP